MNKRPKRKGASEKALKIVFSVILLTAAVGLFLMSEAGRKLLAVKDASSVIQTDASPVASAEETPLPFPLPADFIEAVSQGGPEGVDYRRTQSDEDSAAYQIVREELGLDPAHLVLSLKDGRMTAFMLVWDIPETPELPQENATSIEQNLYVLRCEKNESDSAWLKESFIEMADAFDVADSISAAALEVLYQITDEVLKDGKMRSETEGNFEFSAFVDENTLSLVFLSKQEEN